jgi:hypothetical protein
VLGQENYLTFHEIVSTLLGEKGINTLKGIPPKNISLTPEGAGWFNDPTHPSRRKIPHSDLEDDENRKETQLKIIELIENAICVSEISSPDNMGPRGIETLKFRVGYESFFLWFKNNPEKKNLIEVWLVSLDRQFPKHWVDIINTYGETKLEPTTTIETKEKDTNQPDNIFIKDGTFWRITFMGKNIPSVKHTDGMQYISILLCRSEFIPVTELYQAVKGGNVERMGAATEEDALLDKTARSEYKKKLSKLNEYLEEAKTLPTTDKKEDIEDEIRQIQDRIKKDTDIRNKRRSFSDAEENIRQTVRQAVTTAIKNITEADKEVGEHLKKTIAIGKTPAYESSGNQYTLSWNI